MLAKRNMSREELLALKPAEFLLLGYRDMWARPRPEFTSVYATAVAYQLEAAQAAPQELAATLEAFRQVLPWHKSSAPVPERMAEAAEEALSVVERLYGKPNHPGIVDWVDRCVSAVQSAEEIPIFLSHLAATVRQYAVIASLRKS
jgi:hypothetical protein